MQKTSFLTFTILICSVHSFEDNYREDKKLFRDFVEEIYGHGYRMESFIDLMWLKIQEVVPELVRLPAVEFLYSDNLGAYEYMCAKETTARVKVGNIVNKKLMLQSKEKLTFEVEAELLLDASPVEFEVTKRLSSYKASPTVPVSYIFQGPNTVRFVLEIYNFLRERNILIPQCLIRVKDILVDDLNEPAYTSEVTDMSLKQIEKDFWKSITSHYLTRRALITIGLVKAVNEQLNANGNFWVRSSKYLKNVDEGYKEDWTYTEDYFKYCLKKDENV